MPFLMIPLNYTGIQFRFRLHTSNTQRLWIAFVERHVRYPRNKLSGFVQVLRCRFVLLHDLNVFRTASALYASRESLVPHANRGEEFSVGLRKHDLSISIRPQPADELTQRFTHSECAVLLLSRLSDGTEGMPLFMQSRHVTRFEIDWYCATHTFCLCFDAAESCVAGRRACLNLTRWDMFAAVIAVCNLNQGCTLLFQRYACGQFVHDG